MEQDSKTADSSWDSSSCSVQFPSILLLFSDRTQTIQHNKLGVITFTTQHISTLSTSRELAADSMQSCIRDCSAHNLPPSASVHTTRAFRDSIDLRRAAISSHRLIPSVRCLLPSLRHSTLLHDALCAAVGSAMRCLSVRSVSLLVLVSLLLYGLLSPTSAVDRKKFRTCQDTAFCKRNRAQAADKFQGPHRFHIPVRAHNNRTRTALPRTMARRISCHALPICCSTVFVARQCASGW